MLFIDSICVKNFCLLKLISYIYNNHYILFSDKRSYVHFGRRKRSVEGIGNQSKRMSSYLRFGRARPSSLKDGLADEPENNCQRAANLLGKLVEESHEHKISDEMSVALKSANRKN